MLEFYAEKSMLCVTAWSLRAILKMLFLFPLSHLPPTSSESSLAMGVFLDFSYVCLTRLDREFFPFFPATVSHPRGVDWIPPQTLRTGAGVWGRRAGCLVWRPGLRTPRILHCLRVWNCPGSWQEAFKHQPRADHIPGQTVAPSQEGKRNPQASEGKRQPFHRPQKRLGLPPLFLLPS